MSARFYADLHIHSRFSRATSPNCTPEGLAHWAQRKGVTVCGTGDCTHPGWMAELQEKLELDPDSDLYRLAPRYQALADEQLPLSCKGTVRFLVTGEISCIYKRDNRVRKVHAIVLLPSLQDAKCLNERLSKIGNIISDGRPILGLDPRTLLQVMLEINPSSMLIPAHIWTPWFSMLGAKSGFDSLEECFGEWSSYIAAVETGLSSDAPMNHRIRCLDRVALVSNSDLHSPANLGRNANLFFGQPSFQRIRQGLINQDPAICGGTIDLYPEEGKYFFDGHRTCRVCQTPEQSMLTQNICPVCKKELTIGVLHRIVELERAQRPASMAQPSLSRLPYQYIIPLPELLAQTLSVAPTSKKVQAAYADVQNRVGPELPFLLDMPSPELLQHAIGPSILAMRQGHVIRSGGFDGEYGMIHVNTAAL